MSADEFRAWLVRRFTQAVVIAGIVLIWPHEQIWVYALVGIGVAIIL